MRNTMQQKIRRINKINMLSIHQRKIRENNKIYCRRVIQATGKKI